MKKNFFKTILSMDVLSALLFVLALCFGGGFAMANGSPAPATPETPSPDMKGHNTELGGVGASATLTNESDLEAREIDKVTAKFMPWQFPAHTKMVMDARQVPVTKYEIEYPISGSTPLDFVWKKQITASGNASQTFDVGDNSATYAITNDAARAMNPYDTIIFEGLQGYQMPETGTSPELDGDFMARVKSRSIDDNTVTLEAVNNWSYSSSTWSNNMPTIPANTPFHIMANACSESQMEVAPENYLPVTKKVNLQKKNVNIVYTDDFLQQKKEIDFYTDDLSEHALYNYRRKCARTFWLGAKGKARVKPSATMSYEDLYMSEGVIRQILNKFVIDGGLTFDILNEICDMQFGMNSMNNTAYVYCGNGFMKKLLALAGTTKMVDVSLITEKDKWGVQFTEYKNPMGRLVFIMDSSLNDIGYTDCAVVLDMDNMTRYVKYDQKSYEVDMTKGGGPNGEVREAKRRIWSQADCVCTRGFNSILVGPSAKVYGMKSENSILSSICVLDSTKLNTYSSGLDPDSTKSTSVFYNNASNTTDFKTKGLNAAGDVKDNLVVYLGADDPYTGFSAGSMLRWDAETTSWKHHSGAITIEA